MARKTRKLKPKEIKSILGWAEEAIADKREARVWADEAVAYAELALQFPSRERARAEWERDRAELREHTERLST